MTMLLTGDCRLVMADQLGDDSIDAIVCDPPYGLSFMGKGWDHGVPGVEFWQQTMRVLKPGGHLLAFGGTRTFHRLAVAIEDAGFEIRDCLSWMYGSGFPKSMDVSKAIDKAAGAERTQAIGPKPGHEDFVERTDAHSAGGRSDGWDRPWRENPDAVKASHMQFAPATVEAALWEGWGTALKPGWEPIIMARKPFKGTVANNVLAHGVGALNIDASRLEYTSAADQASATPQGRPTAKSGALAGGVQNDNDRTEFERPEQKGRWPANVLLTHDEDCQQQGTREVRGDARAGTELDGKRAGGFYAPGSDSGNGVPSGPVYGNETVEAWECVDGCPIRLLDEQTGTLTSGTGAKKSASGAGYTPSAFGTESRAPGTPNVEYGDSGGASRFFYNGKVSKRERNAGLPPGVVNDHPTVKPIEVMAWLVRMVTPPGGVVLDPFMGSGSTGVAAVREGFEFIGIDQEAAFVTIAEYRIGAVA